GVLFRSGGEGSLPRSPGPLAGFTGLAPVVRHGEILASGWVVGVVGSVAAGEGAAMSALSEATAPGRPSRRGVRALWCEVGPPDQPGGQRSTWRARCRRGRALATAPRGPGGAARSS